MSGVVSSPLYITVCKCLIGYESIRDAFAAFDVNGDGDLEPREFVFVLAKLIPSLHDKNVDSLMEHVKLDSEGNIGISEFVLTFAPGMTSLLAQAHESKVGNHAYSYSKDQLQLITTLSEFLHERFGSVDECFSHFDVFNHGRVSSQQFQRGIQKLSVSIKGPVLDSILRIVDSNADGFINKKDFSNLYDMNIAKPRAMATTLDSVEQKLIEKFGTLEDAFAHLDTQSPHGRITRTEFILGMLNLHDRSFGNRKSFEKIFNSIDRSRTGIITLDDWIEVLRNKNLKCTINWDDDPFSQKQETHSREILCKKIVAAFRRKYESLFNAFKTIDKNNDGQISDRELMEALSDIGTGVTQGQLRILLTEEDSYSKQVFITYREFLRLLDEEK